MDNYPLVSVLLPVYNGELYLEESLNSVLNQTYKNYEIIIINDGSTDNTSNILRRISSEKILIINNKINVGLISSLNLGIEIANGEYIARMDSDDICLPQRIEKQVTFMKKNSEIGICGMQAKFIGKNVKITRSHHPKAHDEICCQLLVFPPFVHSTVMIRSQLIKNYGLRYDHNYIHAEDYDLWERASHLTQLSNMPDLGLLYRIHDQQISKKRIKTQRIIVSKIRQRVIMRLIPNIDHKQFEFHNFIIYPEENVDLVAIKRAENWLVQLLKSNNVNKIYDKKAFEKFLANRWLTICNKATSYDALLWQIYKSSSLHNMRFVGARSEIKFFLKNILPKSPLFRFIRLKRTLFHE